MRGRRPVPNSLKVLRGNPGRRPINDAEPVHDAVDVTMPDELQHEYARAEWTRLVVTLTTRGHVTTVDRSTLIGYCLKYGQWRALEDEARKHPFIVRAPSGYPMPNPAIGMANKAFVLMMKAAVELGITPSSRSRIIAQPTHNPTDAFTAFQHLRPVG